MVVPLAHIDYEVLGARLRAGGVVVYPTDTAYALGCDATNPEAIAKIFAIKERDQNKSLPLIAADMDMVLRYCVLSGKAQELAEMYWPGPLTLVLPVRGASIVKEAQQDSHVAIRVPKQDSAQAISVACNAPIVSTSANHSGNALCYSIGDVRRSLSANDVLIDFMIDAGTLPVSPASTIVRVDGDRITVIREGAIALPK